MYLFFRGKKISQVLLNQPSCGAVLAKAVERIRLCRETDNELHRLIADNSDKVADTVGVVRSIAETSTHSLVPLIHQLEERGVNGTETIISHRFKECVLLEHQLGVIDELCIVPDMIRTTGDLNFFLKLRKSVFTPENIARFKMIRRVHEESVDVVERALVPKIEERIAAVGTDSLVRKTQWKLLHALYGNDPEKKTKATELYVAGELQYLHFLEGTALEISQVVTVINAATDLELFCANCDSPISSELIKAVFRLIEFADARVVGLISDHDDAATADLRLLLDSIDDPKKSQLVYSSVAKMVGVKFETALATFLSFDSVSCDSAHTQCCAAVFASVEWMRTVPKFETSQMHALLTENVRTFYKSLITARPALQEEVGNRGTLQRTLVAVEDILDGC